MDLETRPLPIRRNRTLHYAQFPTGEGEPTLLLTLAAAGDMLCRDNPGVGPRPESEAGDGEEEGCRRRRRFLDALGARRADALTLRQVHSRRVLWTDEVAGSGGEGDGLLTAAAGVLPAVTVADCMPIYLFAAGTPLRGILHSGWKGTGIAEEAFRRIPERFDLSPANITVVLGPSIGPCCYRVDEERAAEFARRWGADAVRRHGGDPYLDLPAANCRLLQELGVRDVRAAGECTVCGEGYGSFRREGPGEFTHMLAMIADFPVD
jgi:hypothetical protein